MQCQVTAREAFWHNGGKTDLISGQKGKEGMKKHSGLARAFCISLLAFMFLPGLAKNVCGKTKEGKTVAGENSGEAASPKDTSSQSRMDAYKGEAKEKLTGLEKKMKELKVDARQTGEKAQSNTKNGMKELKQKKEVLKKDMKKLEAATRKTWGKVKQKVEAAIKDLGKTYDSVRSYFAWE